jgi:hypothetical protein
MIRNLVWHQWKHECRRHRGLLLFWLCWHLLLGILTASDLILQPSSAFLHKFIVELYRINDAITALVVLLLIPLMILSETRDSLLWFRPVGKRGVKICRCLFLIGIFVAFPVGLEGLAYLIRDGILSLNFKPLLWSGMNHLSLTLTVLVLCSVVRDWSAYFIGMAVVGFLWMALFLPSSSLPHMLLRSRPLTGSLAMGVCLVLVLAERPALGGLAVVLIMAISLLLPERSRSNERFTLQEIKHELTTPLRFSEGGIHFSIGMPATAAQKWTVVHSQRSAESRGVRSWNLQVSYPPPKVNKAPSLATWVTFSPSTSIDGASRPWFRGETVASGIFVQDTSGSFDEGWPPTFTLTTK